LQARNLAKVLEQTQFDEERTQLGKAHLKGKDEFFPDKRKAIDDWDRKKWIKRKGEGRR